MTPRMVRIDGVKTPMKAPSFRDPGRPVIASLTALMTLLPIVNAAPSRPIRTAVSLGVDHGSGASSADLVVSRRRFPNAHRG